MENYLGRDLTTQESTIFPTIEGAIEAKIEAALGRQVVQDSTVSTRYYDGNLSDQVFIDDCAGITKVEEIDYDGEATEVDSDDYLSYPLNSSTKTSIAFLQGRVSVGYRKIAVTAKFGAYSAVPEQIKTAALIMVAGIISNPQSLQSESIEGYSRSFQNAGTNPMVQTLIEPFIKRSI